MTRCDTVYQNCNPSAERVMFYTVKTQVKTLTNTDYQVNHIILKILTNKFKHLNNIYKCLKLFKKFNVRGGIRF